MDTCDLLVVGGGILGAGCAREASLDGRRVVLVESGDLAGGTSSSSSKLVHGGLRYLEHGDIGLVREAVLERGDLLVTASHLVEPLDFVLPVVPESRHGQLATRAALMIYDGLAWPRGIGRHRPLGPEEILAMVPHLRNAGLQGGFLYRDARMDDARLCLEVLFDARELGADIRPRTRLSALRRLEDPEIDSPWEAMLVTANGSSIVHARSVLFCVGPWTDSLLESLGLSPAEPLVSPSRGDHLVYPHWGLKEAVILPEPDTDRFFFVIPWQGQVLAGTTEDPWSPLDGDPLPVAADRIRSWMSRYFPTLGREPHAAYSGVRPLAHAPGKPLHKASREHRLTRLAADCHALVGGKYTTFRAIAESTRKIWGGVGQSNSPGRLFPGAWRFPEEPSRIKSIVESWGVPGFSERWSARHGHRTPDLESSLKDCRRAGIEQGLLGPATEIIHAARHEWAGNLVDVAARRTLDAWRPDRGIRLESAMEAVCRTGLLTWNAAEVVAELRRWCSLRTGRSP